MDFILLTHPCGCAIQVYRFGATITSFTACDDRNILFLSRKAILDGSKPIRGGIPLVFPIFGSGIGNMPNHGFARTSIWDVVAIEQAQNEDQDSKIVLKLESNENSRAIWPYEFVLTFEIVLQKNRLITTLSVENKTDTPFEIQALQHTYLKVPTAIQDVSVMGLQGVDFIDKLASNIAETSQESRDKITFKSETDSIYVNVTGPVQVDLSDSLKVKVEKNTWTRNITEPLNTPLQMNPTSDVVVWNPWIDKSQKIADFGDDEYKNMVCVEPGKVNGFVKVLPSQQWSLQQILTVL